MTVHQTAMAERIASDMRKLIETHPRAIEVLYAESILPPTNSADELVGNLDYINSAIDWKPVTTIKMIEASTEIATKYLADFSDLVSHEMETPLVVSLSVDAPEQSVITVIEISDGKIVETPYMILNRQAVGRNGTAGTVYSLIPFRDQDEEIDASVEAKITEAEGIEGIAPTPPATEDTDTGETW